MAKPFAPPGYVWTKEALVLLVRAWHPSEVSDFDRVWNGAPSDSLQRVEAEQKMRPLVESASDFLRGSLAEGKISAVFTAAGQKGSKEVDQSFWLSDEANGVIETGSYQSLDLSLWPYHVGPELSFFVSKQALANLENTISKEDPSAAEVNRNKSRVSRQEKAAKVAFESLYPNGIPPERDLSNLALHRAVVRYLAEHMTEYQGIGEYAVLTAAGRKKKKQRPKRAEQDD